VAIRREQRVPDLAPRTIAVLLHGWTSQEPPETSHHEGFEGEFLTLYEIGGIARLWKQHEAFLRETARRWGSLKYRHQTAG
jgi:hypothetical protein